MHKHLNLALITHVLKGLGPEKKNAWNLLGVNSNVNIHLAFGRGSCTQLKIWGQETSI